MMPRPFFIVVASCLLNYPVTGGTTKMCSEYLLSGFSGVPNEAFTASSSYSGEGDFSPDNARLYYEKRHSDSSSGWCADFIDSSSYIQVKFEKEATVDSVSTQGRGDYGQWVKTFHLLHSMDGVSWTTVTSSDNSPKLFTGNTDTATVVRNDISPPIRAKYVRINARTFQQRPCLRFGLGVCKLQPEMSGRFALASLPSITTLGQPINLQSPSTNTQHCCIACQITNDCVSFRFDMVTQTCHGYTSIRKTSYSSNEIAYYYNTVYDHILGYRHAESGDFSYKVIELRQNQINATELCVSQGSWLVKVGTVDRTTILQTAIQQNNLLQQDYRFYVSGQYTTQWQYNDGDVIDNTLWSPSNPDPAQGHCVMLTQSGLSSVDCTELLFFICEI